MLKNNFLPTLVILVLLFGNVYLSFQYISTVKELQNIKSYIAKEVEADSKATQVLKLFLDVVFATRGVTSSDDRIKLENDLRQLNDPAITSAWEKLIQSKDNKTYQTNALKVIGLLEDKITK